MRLPPFLLPLAFILLIAVALYTERQQLLGRGDFHIAEEKGRPGVTRLVWRDAIEAPMALRLEEALNTLGGRSNTVILDLHSSGGALREGRKVIEAIERAKSWITVETYVGRNRRCLSMCVPIYLQGDVRTAHARSIWMFHQPIAVDAITDEVIDEPRFERDRAGNRFIDNYFATSDMNPAWREQLRRDWVGREIWKSGEDLVNEGANIVQYLDR